MIRLFILVVALTSGVAAFWVYRALPSSNDPAPQERTAQSGEPHVELQVVEAPTVAVLLASGTVDPGDAISEDMLEWQNWPESAVQPEFILQDQEPDAIDRAVLLVAPAGLEPGDPIRWTRLAQPRAPYLSENLPQGKRAIALGVSVENTAGGFVLPNDRVDVIHTYMSRTDEPISRTIATNVRVIAMDQSTSNLNDSVSVISRTATLELDSQQVEAVTAAEMRGRLSLALRSGADAEEVSTVISSESQPVMRVIRNGRLETISVSQ